MIPLSTLGPLVAKVRISRDAGVDWLLKRIGDDGKPAGADERPGWPRIPWALALSGRSDVAAAVLGWAERHALDEDGGFRPGPARGDGVMNAYTMGHLAIGAWLAERYDLALAIMGKLATFQHPETGGINAGILGPGGVEVQELLLTAQVGVAALVTGQDDVIDGIYGWIGALYADQPALPEKLFSMREGASLLTTLPARLAWLGCIDFHLPRQTFYNPGIAAAFLAGISMRRGDAKARALGTSYLSLNIRGTAAQFDDLDAVQICKFGWGASTMLLADPGGDWLKHVVRMAEWFVARQDPDGGWAPSRYMLPSPSEVDRMIKTAEHVMEVNTILAAIGAAQARATNQ